MVRLVDEANPDAIALVQDAGRLIGEVLATAVDLLNPTVVVIGGDLARSREHLMAGIRERLYERTVPALTSTIAVVDSQLREPGRRTRCMVIVAMPLRPFAHACGSAWLIVTRGA